MTFVRAKLFFCFGFLLNQLFSSKTTVSDMLLRILSSLLYKDALSFYFSSEKSKWLSNICIDYKLGSCLLLFLSFSRFSLSISICLLNSCTSAAVHAQLLAYRLKYSIINLPRSAISTLSETETKSSLRPMVIPADLKEFTISFMIDLIVWFSSCSQ